jgi:hypothetical protein
MKKHRLLTLWTITTRWPLLSALAVIAALVVAACSNGGSGGAPGY